MLTRSGRHASQREDELRPFIELLVTEGVTSYVEIGARHGDTFFAVMKALPRGAVGVAVDLGGGPWGTPDSVTHLESAAAALRADGYEISVVLGDSTTEGVRSAVRALSPFDAVLIDGDHRYEGVKADWLNYGPMAGIVGLHDIDGEGQSSRDGMPVEVPQLWREIRRNYRHLEIIGNCRGMGIGVIWR